jgi:hypothetical protein
MRLALAWLQVILTKAQGDALAAKLKAMVKKADAGFEVTADMLKRSARCKASFCVQAVCAAGTMDERVHEVEGEFGRQRVDQLCNATSMSRQFCIGVVSGVWCVCLSLPLPLSLASSLSGKH